MKIKMTVLFALLCIQSISFAAAAPAGRDERERKWYQIDGDQVIDAIKSSMIIAGSAASGILVRELLKPAVVTTTGKRLGVIGTKHIESSVSERGVYLTGAIAFLHAINISFPKREGKWKRFLLTGLGAFLGLAYDADDLDVKKVINDKFGK